MKPMQFGSCQEFRFGDEDKQGHCHEDIIALTRRGIENLQKFVADVRTWPDGMRQFLIDEMCEPDIAEKIIANEPR